MLPQFLSFLLPFGSSLPPHPHLQHSSQHNAAGRAKSARSRSNCPPRRFPSMSDLAAIPPTMSTTHATHSMTAHLNTSNASNGASSLPARIILTNIGLPSRPTSHDPWAVLQKPLVIKVRTFFGPPPTVNIISPLFGAPIFDSQLCARDTTWLSFTVMGLVQAPNKQLAHGPNFNLSPLFISSRRSQPVAAFLFVTLAR